MIATAGLEAEWLPHEKSDRQFARGVRFGQRRGLRKAAGFIESAGVNME
jgi:hypothetical protein